MIRRIGVPAAVCAGVVAAIFSLTLIPQGWAGDGPPPPPSSGPGFRNMTLLSNLPLSAIGGGQGSSMWGWTDPLTHHEYAIFGRSNGTAFVDMTDPRNPKYVANLPKISLTADTSWREPKVYQNYVYVGVDGTTAGMQVMDLTKLRAYSGTTMTLAADNVYTGVTKIHTLAINPQSGYLYLCGTNVNSGGLRVMDVHNPANPVAVGNTTLDGYTHETEVVNYTGPDATYAGHEVAFNCNGPNRRLSILDVTNKSNITRISSATYTNNGYIHQGWLTDDQRYFFEDDELDEQNGLTGGHTRTHLWDVSDLDNPVYKGFFDNTTTSIDHNLYVKNGFLFESNYTTGLRMFKIGDLSSSTSSNWLQEVAFYDTYPANDGATFNGAWNNYPFFASGNVPVSDINGGLFILQPHVPGWKLGAFDGGDGGGNGGNGINTPEPAALGLIAAASLLALGRRRS